MKVTHDSIQANTESQLMTAAILKSPPLSSTQLSVNPQDVYGWGTGILSPKETIVTTSTSCISAMLKFGLSPHADPNSGICHLA